jgi:hypothetical protein
MVSSPLLFLRSGESLRPLVRDAGTGGAYVSLWRAPAELEQPRDIEEPSLR